MTVPLTHAQSPLESKVELYKFLNKAESRMIEKSTDAQKEYLQYSIVASFLFPTKDWDSHLRWLSLGQLAVTKFKPKSDDDWSLIAWWRLKVQAGNEMPDSRVKGAKKFPVKDSKGKLIRYGYFIPEHQGVTEGKRIVKKLEDKKSNSAFLQMLKRAFKPQLGNPTSEDLLRSLAVCPKEWKYFLVFNLAENDIVSGVSDSRWVKETLMLKKESVRPLLFDFIVEKSNAFSSLKKK